MERRISQSSDRFVAEINCQVQGLRSACNPRQDPAGSSDTNFFFLGNAAPQMWKLFELASLSGSGGMLWRILRLNGPTMRWLTGVQQRRNGTPPIDCRNLTENKQPKRHWKKDENWAADPNWPLKCCAEFIFTLVQNGENGKNGKMQRNASAERGSAPEFPETFQQSASRSQKAQPGPISVRRNRIPTTDAAMIRVVR